MFQFVVGVVLQHEPCQMLGGFLFMAYLIGLWFDPDFYQADPPACKLG
jgi:hypothetical protein